MHECCTIVCSAWQPTMVILLPLPLPPAACCLLAADAAVLLLVSASWRSLCSDYANGALPWGEPDWAMLQQLAAGALAPAVAEGPISNVLAVAFDNATYPVSLDGLHTVSDHVILFAFGEGFSDPGSEEMERGSDEPATHHARALRCVQHVKSPLLLLSSSFLLLLPLFLAGFFLLSVLRASLLQLSLISALAEGLARGAPGLRVPRPSRGPLTQPLPLSRPGI